ncbi:hypothetical protein ACFLQN_03515 [Candidatus Aenigmatarchaeota archaeon]
MAKKGFGIIEMFAITIAAMIFIYVIIGMTTDLGQKWLIDLNSLFNAVSDSVPGNF